MVRTDGGRTVTWLPNLLRWVDYHIFVPMEFRCARFACESSAIIERSRADLMKRRVTNRIGVHCNRDSLSCRHEKLSGIDLFTDRYGSHIESIRFKGYYRMAKGHEHDPIYSLSIYARFSANFSLSFPIRKIFKGKKDRCTVFGCNNDCLFRRKYTVKFSFGPKSGRKY